MQVPPSISGENFSLCNAVSIPEYWTAGLRQMRQEVRIWSAVGSLHLLLLPLRLQCVLSVLHVK